MKESNLKAVILFTKHTKAEVDVLGGAHFLVQSPALCGRRAQSWCQWHSRVGMTTPRDRKGTAFIVPDFSEDKPLFVCFVCRDRSL